MKYPYIKAANPTEYSVFEGTGKSAKDQKTVTKDIPCQAALKWSPKTGQVCKL